MTLGGMFVEQSLGCPFNVISYVCHKGFYFLPDYVFNLLVTLEPDKCENSRLS